MSKNVGNTQNKKYGMEGVTIYHTPIKVKTIAKNGSERFGANAVFSYWYGDSEMIIETTIHGKTKKEAKQKAIKFISGNGKNKVVKSELKKTEYKAFVEIKTDEKNDYPLAQ